MTSTDPKILALDFDGVICDGLIEYFQVAWRSYCQVWSCSERIPPDDLAAQFYPLRPVIETGWEMPVLIKALIAGIPATKILHEWSSINQQILRADNLMSAEIGAVLDKQRDQWITTDLDSWLDLHRFYPGVVEKIKSLSSSIALYIITTKEGRFAKQILQKAGIDLPQAVIFGKEEKRPKYDILRELIQEHQLSDTIHDVWFVEDRLKTLQLVLQQPDLKQMQLFLADWGYNISSDREIAKNDPQIKLLSLSQFGQDFSAWL